MRDDFIVIVRKVSQFKYQNKINKIGIYEIKQTDIDKLNIDKHLVKLLFYQIDDETRLSRGKLYYDTELACLYYKDMINLVKEAYKFPTYIECAVYENIISILSIIWFDLWKKHSKNDDSFFINIINDLHLDIISLACLYINAIWGRKIKYNFKIMYYISQLYDLNLITRRYCEYDHLCNILQELCFVNYNILQEKFDLIGFPLFGSFKLHIFYEALQSMVEFKCASFCLDIGFHDQGQKLHEISMNTLVPSFQASYFKKNMTGKKLLIMDDNIGTGNTLAACKDIMSSYGIICITRACEIPWDVVIKTNSFRHIANVIDIPTVKINLRILTKKQYIRNIENPDTYKQLSQLEDEKNFFIYETKNRMNRLLISNVWSKEQLKYIFDEYEFYKNMLSSI